MQLTLKGLEKLGRSPALRRPIHRTQFAGPQDDPRGLSVLVYQPDLVALEGKLREVDLLLHKARLKVRSLLRKEHKAGRTEKQRSDQQQWITGNAWIAKKRKVPFVSPQRWKRFKDPEKELVRAMYAYQPGLHLRSKFRADFGWGGPTEYSPGHQTSSPGPEILNEFCNLGKTDINQLNRATAKVPASSASASVTPVMRAFF